MSKFLKPCALKQQLHVQVEKKINENSTIAKRHHENLLLTTLMESFTHTKTSPEF